MSCFRRCDFDANPCILPYSANKHESNVHKIGFQQKRTWNANTFPPERALVNEFFYWNTSERQGKNKWRFKLTHACTRVERLKNASLFCESSKNSSIVPVLLTATRAVCIIYFAAQAVRRAYFSLYAFHGLTIPSLFFQVKSIRCLFMKLVTWFSFVHILWIYS